VPGDGRSPDGGRRPKPGRAARERGLTTRRASPRIHPKDRGSRHRPEIDIRSHPLRRC
jgi:hypothetical protein